MWALHEFYEDGDILALPGVGAVDVGRQLVEVQLHSGVRVELRGSLKHQAGVEFLLEGLEACLLMKKRAENPALFLILRSAP